ncbi:MAG TPA: roadblock/LC7 domain-containing protein [Burkholderiaceae bacterium]|nr:roadblock/LC7 domain-containing protein [Burkholderiaceae bacterium]
MNPLLASKARSLLRALRNAQPGIEGCALISSDGRVMASALGEGTDPDRFGAMCAALLALSARAAAEAQRGQLQQLILEGSAGPMLLTQAGRCGVLAVAAASDCPLGRLILDAKSCAQALGTLLDAPPRA